MGQERGGPARAVEIDPEGAHPLEDAVLAEHRGVEGGAALAAGEESAGQHDHHRGVPPGRVVAVDDRSGPMVEPLRQAPAGEAQRVEVAPHEALEIAEHEPPEPGRDGVQVGGAPSGSRVHHAPRLRRGGARAVLGFNPGRGRGFGQRHAARAQRSLPPLRGRVGRPSGRVGRDEVPQRGEGALRGRVMPTGAGRRARPGRARRRRSSRTSSPSASPAPDGRRRPPDTDCAPAASGCPA